MGTTVPIVGTGTVGMGTVGVALVWVLKLQVRVLKIAATSTENCGYEYQCKILEHTKMVDIVCVCVYVYIDEK